MTEQPESGAIGPAIIVLGQSGLDMAERVRECLANAEIHGLERRVGRADILFDEVSHHLRHLFCAGRPIIGICAAGILIRALSDVLSDKTMDPPVLAVAEDGSVVVPLLGGHHGANDLARRIASATAAFPGLTTAGDVRFGVALDDPPRGWILANPESARNFTADLLDGARVELKGGPVPPFLEQASFPRKAGGPLRITVTCAPGEGNDRHLVYHPACVAVGVGCERGVSTQELQTLVEKTLQQSGLTASAVAGLFSLDLKADELAIHDVARCLGVPARFLDADTLEACTPRLETPSEVVFRAVGCHGVAEAAALTAGGTECSLVVPKQKSRHATCAIALAEKIIDPEKVGKSRGRLLIVGIGPGSESWMTAESTRALEVATDLVGYTRYLDLLGDRVQGRERHDFGLGQETLRVRTALNLASEGRTVALVCSGDPGIYAMASLVFEQLDRTQRGDWHRVAIEVCPGVSALQAAAARAGAPLGHDFCTLSLSDLLTPWTVIERRLRAAAQGDFVVVFYNPASSRRPWQLPAARDILLEARPPATPVIIARNLGRDGETLSTTTLASLGEMTIDMFSVVIVGSTETRTLDRGNGQSWIYTPRGYKSDTAGRSGAGEA